MEMSVRQTLAWMNYLLQQRSVEQIIGSAVDVVSLLNSLAEDVLCHLQANVLLVNALQSTWDVVMTMVSVINVHKV